MSAIRAMLLPALLRDPSQPLTVRILLPRNAPAITVRLVELDAWRFLREDMLEEEGGVATTLATFVGRIENGRFEIDSTDIPDAGDGEGSLKLTFHGSSDEHQIPVAREIVETDGGELELGLEIEATVVRRGQEVREEFRSAYPTFVRNTAALPSGNRPVITFITGHDLYQRAARRFWRRRADVVVVRRSVESILRYLNNPENVQRLGCDKWGQINIVSHASVNYWYLPLFEDSLRQSRPVDYPRLATYGNDSRLTPPPSSIVDGDTQIVLRGCNIGRNTDLCRAIRNLFGGNAWLHAPRFLQFYHLTRRGGRRRERELFYESLYFFVPGRETPNDDECLRRLQNKYSDRNIDSGEWERLLNAEGERQRREGNVGWTFGRAYESFPPILIEQIKDDLRRDWSSGPMTYHTTVDDWEWHYEPQFSQNDDGSLRYRLKLLAWRRLVEVRRPLTTESGETVVPVLSDNTHYEILS